MIKNNILFITLGDQTGANTAILKVACALQEQGHNVQVLVRDKKYNNPIVYPLPARDGFVSGLGTVVEKGRKKFLDRDLKYLYNTVNENNSYADTDVILQQLHFKPQIIFVGITFDFLTSTDILKLSRATQAVVYNLAVDMSHFTGGCHFAWDCKGYVEGCHKVKCPAILDEGYKDLAARNFLIKKENVAQGNFKLLAGTDWIRDQAYKSAIYTQQEEFFNIAGVVDTAIYNLGDRLAAKAAFQFSNDIFYILAGAENTQDVRKGFHYFVDTVNLFWTMLSAEQREKVEVITVTRIQNQELYDAIKFRKTNINYIDNDQQLAQLYQSADVFVNCSVEDSGPSMLIEAMACGTPLASFNMGAAAEYIEDGKTGFIVPNKDTTALAETLLKIYGFNRHELQQLGEAAHRKVLGKGSLKQAVSTMSNILASHQTEFDRLKKTMSVAMCTWNGALYLAEQLDSILNQDTRPDEIIICDDISTDDTIAIVEKYQNQYPELIKLYRNEHRLGVVKNFEKAINLCSKDIIFLCDQDDIWVPNKMETIVDIFDRFPHIEAINHNLSLWTEGKRLLEATMWDTMGFRFFVNSNYKHADYLLHTLLFGNMVTGAAFCMKKPKNPIFLLDNFPGVIHDYQLSLEFLSKDTLYFHNECLGVYRQHRDQQIGANLQNTDQRINHIKRYYEARIALINLFFTKVRMETSMVFQYLEEKGAPEAEALIRSHVKNTAIGTLKPNISRRQLKLMKEALIINEKYKGTTNIGYSRFFLSILQNFIELIRLYIVIVYSSIFRRKTSVFRFIANSSELAKEKYHR